MLRIQLIDAGLRSVNLSLKRWLFELIKEIAFFDFRAFNKRPLFEKRCNSRNEGDAAHCLDPTNEFIGLSYLLPLGPNHTYGGRTCRLLCGGTTYKPAAKRRWGYFALPVLRGDRLVGKADVIADRKASVLRVNAIHQDVRFTRAITKGVCAELDDLAAWLTLGKVELPAG